MFLVRAFEIRYLVSPTRNYEWVFEADIAACFDEINHTALMGRVRRRVSDKRVLALVTAFLRAGVLTEDAVRRDTITGTPQGGILSPLLANIALSSLDEHFTAKWEALGPEWTRAKARRAGHLTMKIVRYADDFVVMVNGRREHAEALWDEVTVVLAPMACACRSRRAGSATSTRASSSWAGASSSRSSQEPRNGMSTPGRRRSR